MPAKEATDRLGVTQRMLRHYKKEDLMAVGCTEKGYRHYSECDLRRAARIFNFVATGFSTREIRAMSACLSDGGTGPRAAGIDKLTEKLAPVDQLQTGLDERRAAVHDRQTDTQNGLSNGDVSGDATEPASARVCMA